MEINGSTVTFTSGKDLYVGHGILGLVAPGGNNNHWAVTEGGNIIGQNDLSNNELIEMADHMIGKWSKFKEFKMGL